MGIPTNNETASKTRISPTDQPTWAAYWMAKKKSVPMPIPKKNMLLTRNAAQGRFALKSWPCSEACASSACPSAACASVACPSAA